jgi:hypothetical protein
MLGPGFIKACQDYMWQYGSSHTDAGAVQPHTCVVEDTDLVEGAAPILRPMETHRPTCSSSSSSSSIVTNMQEACELAPNRQACRLAPTCWQAQQQQGVHWHQNDASVQADAGRKESPGNLNLKSQTPAPVGTCGAQHGVY